VKYFTAGRLMRLQDRSSTVRFHAALNDWENAVAAYRQHLQRVAPKLPGGLRRLIGSVALHDARVLAIAHGLRGRFSVTLHPESDPSRFVVLDYSLVEPPEVTVALHAAACSDPVAWLYDELDFVEKGKRKVGPTFRHAILLSNGWELRLHFARVTVRRPAAFLPGGIREEEGAASVSRTA
jgi:hypothetical protein